MTTYRCALSDEMFSDFQEGKLHNLLNRVLQDDTLNLEFRGDNGANIYYRGGNLFSIKKDGTDYKLSFDIKYCEGQSEVLPANPSIKEATKHIPYYKQIMDFWFSCNRRLEREFAQITVRDNNRHGDNSHATDYYIVTSEYPYLHENGKNSNFDMTAIKWLSESAVRKNKTAPTLAIIEMKYGDGALDGKAGLADHLRDVDDFLHTADLQQVRVDQAKVFSQKCKLGLIPDMKDKPSNITIDSDNVELIFLLANHDPASRILKKIVSAFHPNDYSFTIKIAFASMMGYCLYDDRMMTLDKFKAWLS